MFWASATLACNVPVFRYALERWEADRFQIFVFHNESLNTEQEAILAPIEKAQQDGLANIEVIRINLEQEMPGSVRALWDAQEHPTQPWMVVRYPKQTGIERSVWTGPLGAKAVDSLIESPARREIAQKLSNGDAIVWLLLGGDDPKRNENAESLLKTELGKLEKSLVLPERSPTDPPINPDLPLKIAFSIVRLSRSDPAEHMLLDILLNWNPNLIAAREPLLFPIFGRGRVIPPAMGDQIRPEAIREMAEFLTGPCSCEVKELNPGYDLLLAKNWNTLPGYQEILVAPPPPLVGISEFAAEATTHSTDAPSKTNILTAAPGAQPAGIGRDRLWRNLVVVLCAGLAFLVVSTLALKIRSGRRPR
ncbi:MAG TPA: hypothetical protein P5186_22370 [Candidatus Paceibacterota bacterium]|nr:hypothetical protein [Verrucomicrobiota bacterium]HRY50805.1 hypothetical protein [Candidatus Paceibacterota bacterium]HSA02236.1 hypothetical protein [Candidatus Paceibacterota bacterium]